MFLSGPVTDSITHFIGLFHLTESQERLRLDYDVLDPTVIGFETGPIISLDHSVGHGYAPRDISVQVRHTPPAPVQEQVENAVTPLFAAPTPVQGIAPPWHAPADPSFDTSATVQPLGRIEMVIPPPGSGVAVIVQSLGLEDIDHLDIDKMEHVVDARVLGAELDALVQMAEAAGVAPVQLLPEGGESFMCMAQGLQQSIADAPADGFLATGAEAFGMFLDGAVGAERPELDGLMPQDWRDRAEREENNEDGPTHELIHGGNLLANEVVLTASWISAPVMVVGGDSVSIDLIAQVNVWQDNDLVEGLAHGFWVSAPGGTAALNFASLDHAAHPLPVPAEEAAGFPAIWAVVTIEGSLLNFNWVEQHNFVSDGDVTSITLTGTSTSMIFGANQSINAASLFELGWEFDLIIVDGHLINLAAIFQTNVLLDSDHVTLRDGGGVVSAGDNLLLNDASILQVGQGSHMAAAGGYRDLLTNPDKLSSEVLSDPAFAGLEGLRVLHVKGDLVTAQIIKQVNVLGDADQVDLLAAQAMENAGDIAVVTGSNVLVNSAHIAEFGIDSTIHTAGNVYSDALIHQAELVDSGNPYTAPGLATEAVVFLADGMVGGAATPDDAAIGGTSDFDMISIDPLQTVLA